METVIKSTIIHLKWRFKTDHSICVTEDKKVINIKTGRYKKQTINGGYSDGFWIGKDFIPTNRMNQHLELIPKEECPF